jgi:phage baseplate assembly protein gpV
MTDTMGTNTGVDPLPPGVHPMDPSTGPDPVPALPDTVGNRYNTGAAPYKTDNDGAVPVYQRAAHEWDVNIIVVNSTDAQPAEVVGRQKGRQSVTLTVPTTLPNGTTPDGVVFGPNRGALQQTEVGGGAGVLNAGDSVTINTEAPVYATVITGNATGAVQAVVEFNPPGGGLGS